MAACSNPQSSIFNIQSSILHGGQIMTNTDLLSKENSTDKGKGKLVQKIVIVGVIILLIILFYVFDVGQYFSFDYIIGCFTEKIRSL